MIQQTSMWAYQTLEKLGRKQKDCYGVIERRGTACNYDIAHELGWDINRVTPRVKELRDLMLVGEAYREINPYTDRTSIYWEIVNKGE